MNEPVLSKAHPHGYDYKVITEEAYTKIKEAAQKVADDWGYPVYLVGSATYKDVPRDIDISVIIPLKEYEEMFGKIPDKYGMAAYLGEVFHQAFIFTAPLHFCVEYHLDIKVCPDTWWPDKPKLLLAKPMESKERINMGKDINGEEIELNAKVKVMVECKEKGMIGEVRNYNTANNWVFVVFKNPKPPMPACGSYYGYQLEVVS